MITIENAYKLILQNTTKLDTEIIQLSNLFGRVLAEDIISDINMPPFNKSAMDGYAVRSKDIKNASVRLKVIGEIPAGEFKDIELKQNECLEIMTGAPVPSNLDAVVKVEDTEREGDTVLIKKIVLIGENICKIGEDIQEGQCVVDKDSFIKAPEVASIAACGRANVEVYKVPRVGVIATGNELVEPGEKIIDGQIRNSNAYQLINLFKSLCCEVDYLGIAQDTVEDLTKLITKGFNYDVLAVSGAVSMGKYDSVPEVLNNLGAKTIFHNVFVKPGKPFLFAKKDKTHIFCMPGNPVSNFTTFYMFVRFAVFKMMGRFVKDEFNFIKATLTSELTKRGERVRLVPSNLYIENGEYQVTPLGINGSADITGCLGCNALVVMDSDLYYLKADQKVKCIKHD